jgi:AcrR family transcriptional regulator
MSPYPARVSHDGIVQKARDLIEAEGLDDLSLNRLAAALGIRAPSLYKHFGSKAELLRAVNMATNRELVAALQEAVASGDTPKAQAMAMARAYRHFACTHPITYGLAYSNLAPEQRPDPRKLESMALSLQRVWTAICGPDDSLAALRGAWALLHGYVMLELNGHFQRGGNLEEQFERAVQVYIDGWAADFSDTGRTNALSDSSRKSVSES